jgi:hypothetical protein
MTPFTDYAIDELISVCIARQIVDGEIVAQGIATPLVAAGYLLAKCTHAPNLFFASAIGQGVCQDWAPLGVSTIESLWLDKSLKSFGFAALSAQRIFSSRANGSTRQFQQSRLWAEPC